MKASTRELLDDVGLLLLRLGLGAGMALGHGMRKLENFGELSERFADPFGMGSAASLALAVFAEVGCSALLIFGLMTRLASVPLMITMLVAVFMVHGDDPWARKELAAAYLLGYVVILLTGAGKFSLDARSKGWLSKLR